MDKTRGLPGNPFRILLAEYDKEMRALLARALRKAGYEVIEYSNGVDLLEKVCFLIENHAQKKVDLIISDNRMPGVIGMEVLEELHCHDNITPMILISAFCDRET